jgi:hypothetical protein
LGLLMPMLVAPVVVMGGIRIAENDIEPPIDRGEHEPGGNERAETEHGENERRRPGTCAAAA